MKLKPTVLIMILSFELTARAGDSFGNGGHAVVCRDQNSNIISAESLDLYEMHALYGYEIDAITSSGFLGRDVISYIDRMRPYSKVRSRTLDNFSLNFEKEMLLLPTALEIVNDYHDAVVPNGCALEQAVVQLNYKEVENGKPRYLISEKIWHALSTDSKHALILHEILYRELVNYSIKHADPFLGPPKISSKRVRQLVASILANRLKDEKQADIERFFDEEFPYSEFEGTLSFTDTNRPPLLLQPEIDEEAYSCFMSMNDSAILVSGQWLQLAPKSFQNCFYQKVWHSNGRLRSTNIKKGERFKAFVNNYHSDLFEFEADEYSTGEGMELVLTSQSSQRGYIRRIGPFKPIQLRFENAVLPINFLETDSEFSFVQPGPGLLGVKVQLTSKTNVKRPNYEILLDAEKYVKHEFYGVSKSGFSYPRKLQGTGKVLWRGKWRTFKNATLTFSALERVVGVCERDSNGGNKCWVR